MAYVNLKKVLAGGGMTVGFFLLPAAALAQHDGSPPTTITSNPILNITEVLTGLAAAFIAFQAAVAYREGRIGRGITWVAVGMVIMAVGHFILVSRRFFHLDPLGFLGSTGRRPTRRGRAAPCRDADRRFLLRNHARPGRSHDRVDGLVGAPGASGEERQREVLPAHNR